MKTGNPTPPFNKCKHSPDFLFKGMFATLIIYLLSSSTVLAELDASLMEGLKARAIGPAAISGRIAAIDAVASDPNHIVVGAATGGVWISENGGLNWRPVFDKQAVASIGAVAINQSNPDIIWVGTGEGNVRNSTSIGGGIYKSTDGGTSWKLMGLEDSERINRIALHPNDPDIVYVAALGTLWGPNETRGVYRTSDGGQSWERLLYVNDSTGATDIKIDTVNPDKLYAGMWQFRRWPWFFKSGGEGSGMYISHDSGDSWQRKTEEDGLPAGELGRMVFALTPANPDRVYALVEAKKSALLRSDDGGDSWIKANQDYNVADRPFYYTELAADPANENIVYNVGTRVRVSIDGGKTFTYNPVIDCCASGNTIHIDNHAHWINPGDPTHLIFGNDGGLAISRDRGETFRFVRNLPLAQFYHIAVDNDHPYNVYGGLQDNGSWRGPAETWDNAGIQNLHWQEVGFGDGFDTLPDPDNSRSGYAMSQGGRLFRWNLDTGEQTFIMPDPPTPDTELRFNWNAALAIDPFDPDTIYYGSQFVHRSPDRGRSWSTISGDLTSNDPAVQLYKETGGLTPDVTTAENYTSIVSIAPSPLQQGVLWVGSDDGRVHISLDGGGAWSRIDTRARGVPKGTWVPMIAPSPHDAGTAFVVFDDHRRSNMETYLYRVENNGQRWARLSNEGITGYALSILQDDVDPDLLLAGTEFGLHVSTNGGDSWTRFTAGVPTVSVMDMAIQAREHDLVLGTHGRAVYVIDDYRALRNLNADDFEARLKLLSTTPGQQYEASRSPSTRFTGSGEFRAPNEPYGVMLTFMASGDDLPHPDADEERARKIRQREQTSDDDIEAETPNGQKPSKVLVTVSDTKGATVRTYEAPVHQGINRLVWPMQADGIRPVSKPENGDRYLPPGLQVLPGEYTVSLKLGDTEVSETVEVLQDPRSPYSMEDLVLNHAARTRLLRMQDTANTALRQIGDARSDLDMLSGLLERGLRESDDEGVKSLKEQVAEHRDKLLELEKFFRTPEKTPGIMYNDHTVNARLGAARYYVGSTGAAPSPAAESYVEMAEQALTDATGKVNAYMRDDIKVLREAIQAAGVGLLTETESVELPD